MKVSESKLVNLVEYLQGTCKSLSEGCNALGFDYDDLTLENLEDIDNNIFQCTGCGWWYELSEEGDSPDGERLCQNCSDDGEF